MVAVPCARLSELARLVVENEAGVGADPAPGRARCPPPKVPLAPRPATVRLVYSVLFQDLLHDGHEVPLDLLLLEHGVAPPVDRVVHRLDLPAALSGGHGECVDALHLSVEDGLVLGREPFLLLLDLHADPLPRLLEDGTPVSAGNHLRGALGLDLLALLPARVQGRREHRVPRRGAQRLDVAAHRRGREVVHVEHPREAHCLLLRRALAWQVQDRVGGAEPLALEADDVYRLSRPPAREVIERVRAGGLECLCDLLLAQCPPHALAPIQDPALFCHGARRSACGRAYPYGMRP
mmetsp:Transcript_41447/g.132389  ORF Transcript_41447/g.132389 Transcript_41447/m.132389 type:complete len:294 (+) Transcript_41447:465-1346(+)